MVSRVALAMVLVSAFLAAVAHAAPPDNDNFANAHMLSGSALSVSGNNLEATGQTGDPATFCQLPPGCSGGAVTPAPPRNSVWYRWVAPASGSTTVDVCDTNYDPLLGVYTGSGLGSLAEVASNNSGCLSGFGSKVSFAAVGGVTYHIDVDGHGGAPQGNFVLNLFGPSANPPLSPPEPGPTADTEAPDTQITQGPKPKTKQKQATFGFTSTEPGSSFQCAVDGQALKVPCTSPYTVEVKKGNHTFQVRATDPAGNTDPTPARDSWKVKKKSPR
jgi:hypothetical protein